MRAGQLVAQMDDSENRAQRERALGAVHAAEAKLAQTQAGTVVKDTGAEEDYAKARAATAWAREKLTEVEHSARIQDTMAETRVRTAQSVLESAVAFTQRTTETCVIPNGVQQYESIPRTGRFDPPDRCQ